MYFKVLIEKSDGRYSLYLEAESAEAVLDSLKNLPGFESRSISIIEPIGRQEYEAGKVCEWKREYYLKYCQPGHSLK